MRHVLDFFEVRKIQTLTKKLFCHTEYESAMHVKQCEEAKSLEDHKSSSPKDRRFLSLLKTKTPFFSFGRNEYTLLTSERTRLFPNGDLDNVT